MQENCYCCIAKMSTNTQNQRRCPVWKIHEYTQQPTIFFCEIGFEKEKNSLQSTTSLQSNQNMVFKILTSI